VRKAAKDKRRIEFVFREQLRASESHQRAIEAFKTFSGENRKIKCIKAFERF
jgi:hypothetical protein